MGRPTTCFFFLMLSRELIHGGVMVLVAVAYLQDAGPECSIFFLRPCLIANECQRNNLIGISEKCYEKG